MILVLYESIMWLQVAASKDAVIKNLKAEMEAAVEQRKQAL